MVCFKQPLDDETIAKFKESINKKKLSGYLKRYPIATRKEVLNKLRG